LKIEPFPLYLAHLDKLVGFFTSVRFCNTPRIMWSNIRPVSI
jgi:hypothetical protein